MLSFPMLSRGRNGSSQSSPFPANAFAAYLARRIIRLLYQVFGWTTGLPVRALPDYATALFRRGLVLSHERRYLGGLLCSQVWRLPSSLIKMN